MWWEITYWAALSLSFRRISMFMNIIAWGPQVRDHVMSQGSHRLALAGSSIPSGAQIQLKHISYYNLQHRCGLQKKENFFRLIMNWAGSNQHEPWKKVVSGKLWKNVFRVISKSIRTSEGKAQLLLPSSCNIWLYAKHAGYNCALNPESGTIIMLW